MPPQDEQPIDIYYNKLLDWLIDRRHCNLKWQETASSIRENINTAIQDMPPNEELTQLLSGTCLLKMGLFIQLFLAAVRGDNSQVDNLRMLTSINLVLRAEEYVMHPVFSLMATNESDINFFHCKRIIELLKECGEGSTNFFGQYSSQRMKDWQEIINNYTTDNIYLAESASMLARNVNFEIPALKRQIGKYQQIQRECSRKANDCGMNASLFKEKYLKSCSQMGIKGENVKKELVELVSSLPERFNSIAKDTQGITDVLQFYRTFVKFVSKNESIDCNEICKMTSFIIEQGDATVYQWKTGEVPSKIVSEDQTVDLSAMIQLSTNTEGGNEEIDWGDDGDNGEIDWGDNGASGDNGEIDWGDNNGEDIDWRDTGVGGATEGLAAITVEDDGQENPEGGVASGSEALSVLENSTTRNLFIDELLELNAFLDQRILEMLSDADMITVSQFQNAPESLQHQSRDELSEYRSSVALILDNLTSVKMQNLYLIQNSPRYVDRVVESLTQKLRVSENLTNQIATLEQRSREAVAGQAEAEPKLNVIVEKTKVLQKQMEKAISEKYKGRPVNIMGEINSI